MGRGNIVLRGALVALSSMTQADQTKFCVWLQSDELRSLIDDPRQPGLEDQMKWFKRVQQPDRKFFSLVSVPDGVLIGNCGFVDIDTARQEATLRITIGNPDYVGQGLGTEAVQLLVGYGFGTMSLKHILLKVVATNVRAIRTYEKAGFTKASEETKEGKTIVTMSLMKPARV
ncbi:MAG: GNAT family N-acetyltransferase [Candidatus Peribacteraceae bacterium]|nr:GNAT family N-acetyltransferase [Candidatus Peribacteraceae bacterium]